MSILVKCESHFKFQANHYALHITFKFKVKSDTLVCYDMLWCTQKVIGHRWYGLGANFNIGRHLKYSVQHRILGVQITQILYKKCQQ